MAQDTRVQKRETDNVQTAERTRSGRIFIPPVDIVETNNDIIVMADMPGVNDKNIDITLENNVLTIQGSVEHATPEGYQLSYCEYDMGDFHRSFTLTDTIDRDKIEANFKNGVLILKLPKAEKAKVKKITVKTG